MEILKFLRISFLFTVPLGLLLNLGILFGLATTQDRYHPTHEHREIDTTEQNLFEKYPYVEEYDPDYGHYAGDLRFRLDHSFPLLHNPNIRLYEHKNYEHGNLMHHTSTGPLLPNQVSGANLQVHQNENKISDADREFHAADTFTRTLYQVNRDIGIIKSVLTFACFEIFRKSL